MSYRIGLGYDIHKLAAERDLFLGGVKIPFSKGLLGHSDADALLHAICDALLGACGLGDIGERFPDTDKKYKGIASAKLLNEVLRLVKDKGYRIENIDTVIIAQEPKLTPFKKKMQKKIADILNTKQENINIKAKTNEGLGELGKARAIACYSVALLSKGD